MVNRCEAIGRGATASRPGCKSANRPNVCVRVGVGTGLGPGLGLGRIVGEVSIGWIDYRYTNF